MNWKDQGLVPQVGDIVLFKNEPIYRHWISAARVQALLWRKNGDVYGATICYRREVGGRSITVDRHLNQLYPFLWVEMAEPQEQILGLVEEWAAGTLAPNAGTQLGTTQDEFSELWSSTRDSGGRDLEKALKKLFILLNFQIFLKFTSSHTLWPGHSFLKNALKFSFLKNFQFFFQICFKLHLTLLYILIVNEKCPNSPFVHHSHFLI